MMRHMGLEPDGDELAGGAALGEVTPMGITAERMDGGR
jgi:hypothetical protein